MPAWGNELTAEENAAMERLFQELLAGRPRGWSVVRGTGETVVRPAEREIGKVSVRLSPSGQLYASFFSRRRNRWTASGYFAIAEGTAAAIFDWAAHVVLREGASRPSVNPLP